MRNEQETYEYLNSKLPNKGERVETIDGFTGEVSDVNVLRQLVKVVIEEGDEKELREYPVEELKFKRRKKNRSKDKNDGLSEEERKALKELESMK